MNKHFLTALLMSAGMPLALAAPPEQKLADQYFASKNVNLSKQERESLASSDKWRTAASVGVQPTAGVDGAIRYLYGTQQPSVVCAVLQICDIELQLGEQVNSIHLGDTARWHVEPAVTGSGASEVQHLVVKPLDVGLETSLLVTTNRRTYHFRLRSHRTEFMPRIAFTYPEETTAQWVANRKKETQERQERTIPETGEYLGDLSFGYAIEGAAAWKPMRVYNNGVKTIIQMPAAMAQTEAPTLLVMRKDGGWFSEPDMVMVNYRLQGDRYIVDTVFDKAILIAGVGSDQDRVTITREK